MINKYVGFKCLYCGRQINITEKEYIKMSNLTFCDLLCYEVSFFQMTV